MLECGCRTFLPLFLSTSVVSCCCLVYIRTRVLTGRYEYQVRDRHGQQGGSPYALPTPASVPLPLSAASTTVSLQGLPAASYAQLWALNMSKIENSMTVIIPHYHVQQRLTRSRASCLPGGYDTRVCVRTLTGVGSMTVLLYFHRRTLFLLAVPGINGRMLVRIYWRSRIPGI